jgi:hypothetical protein
MERIENPKDVQVSYETLERMQEQIGFAMANLGYASGERRLLEQAYGVLRDLLYLDRCPHAERSRRSVSVPLDTMEQIEKWVNRARDGRNEYSGSIMSEVRFARERRELERVRLAIQEVLYRTQFSHAK